MKFLSVLSIFMVLGFAVQSQAKATQVVISCELYQLHDSYFEESFTAIEYPGLKLVKVAENTYALDIGSSLYKAEYGDKVVYNYGVSEEGEDEGYGESYWATVDVTPEGRKSVEFRLEVNVSWDKGRGQLYFFKNNTSEKILVADLACSGADFL